MLLLASSAYKERWEDTGDPEDGPGAAREANVLKSLFDQDRAAFLKKVKVILLPGVAIADIPTELRAFAQRFEIHDFDSAGLGDLLRTLAGRPEWVLPRVGDLPDLPPRFIDGIIAANRSTGDTTADDARTTGDELRTRLRRVDTETLQTDHMNRRDDLSIERSTERWSRRSGAERLRRARRQCLPQSIPRPRRPCESSASSRMASASIWRRRKL